MNPIANLIGVSATLRSDQVMMYRIVGANSAPKKLKKMLKEDSTLRSPSGDAEVYSLGPHTYFYNGAAILLSEKHGIKLPERGTALRRDHVLSWPVKIFIKRRLPKTAARKHR